MVFTLRGQVIVSRLFFALVVFTLWKCEKADGQALVQYNAAQAIITTSETPPALAWHTATRLKLPTDNIAVVFGGGNADDIAHNRPHIRMSQDIWVFSKELNMWFQCEVQNSLQTGKPKPRLYHIAEPLTPSSADNATTVTTTTTTTTPATGPTTNFTRGVAAELLVVGGLYINASDLAILDDAWKLTIWRSPVETVSFFMCEWTEVPITSSLGQTPAGRFYATSTTHPEDPFTLFVYGGCTQAVRLPASDELNSLSSLVNCTQISDEMWQYTLSAGWRLLSPTGAGRLPPLGGGMMFPIGNPESNQYMLYGGFSQRTDNYGGSMWMCNLPQGATASYSCQLLGQSCEINSIGCRPIHLVSRGSVVALEDKAVFFGVSNDYSDSLAAYLYTFNESAPHAEFKAINILSRLLTPVLSGASTAVGILGGFATVQFASAAEPFQQALFFGDFFRPQTGDPWNTWLFIPRNLEMGSSTPISAVWQDNFFYEGMTARAWPTTQASGQWVTHLGGYSGSVSISDWKFNAFPVIEYERRLRGETTGAAASTPVVNENGYYLSWTRIDEETSIHEGLFSRFQASSALINETTMFVFGGQQGPSGECFDNGFFFEPSIQRAQILNVDHGPSKRRGASMVRIGDKLYLYGGDNCQGLSVMDELWAFDLSTHTWDLIAQGPGPLSYHTAAVLRNSLGQEEMVLFGGFGTNGTNNQEFAWVYNPTQHTWSPVTSSTGTQPSSRTSHCSVRIDSGPVATQLVLIGGRDHKGNALDDAWLYDHKLRSWHRLVDTRGYFRLTQPRFGITCAEYEGAVFVFGGTASQRFYRTVITFRPTCNPGFRTNSQGSCEPCPLSTFRSNLSTPECSRCARDLTTSVVGARSSSECNRCTRDACRHGTGSAVNDGCVCRCNVGYTGKSCDTNALGIALGSFFLLLAIGATTYFVVRYYRLTAADFKQHSELQQQLLEEKDQEIELYEQIWTIMPDELQFVRVLDEGAFGKVELMIWLSTGFQVAVKRLKEAILQLDETCKEDFEREVKFVRQLRHPNIVRFHGAYLGAQPFLVMEYVARGSLQRILADPKMAISVSRRHTFLQDTAAGMNYLHEQTRMHRDLKSANLLVTESWQIKVTDFTTAKNVVQSALTRQQTSSNGEDFVQPPPMSEFNNQDLWSQTTNIGTIPWSAPEVIAGNPYGLPADVYSFGIVISEILTRKLPYWNVGKVIIRKAVVEEGLRPSLETDTPYEPYELLAKRCWDAEPSHRPTFSEIVNFLADATPTQRHMSANPAHRNTVL
eukprot:m.82757 g.82757  ORF g.82757 m.82757 type:complete len:1276 (-) comp14317_c0_seq1:1885-5712(-)